MKKCSLYVEVVDFWSSQIISIKRRRWCRRKL